MDIISILNFSIDIIGALLLLTGTMLIGVRKRCGWLLTIPGAFFVSICCL
jgi:hypothetical protein